MFRFYENNTGEGEHQKTIKTRDDVNCHQQRELTRQEEILKNVIHLSVIDAARNIQDGIDLYGKKAGIRPPLQFVISWLFDALSFKCDSGSLVQYQMMYKYANMTKTCGSAFVEHYMAEMKLNQNNWKEEVCALGILKEEDDDREVEFFVKSTDSSDDNDSSTPLKKLKMEVPKSGDSHNELEMEGQHVIADTVGKKTTKFIHVEHAIFVVMTKITGN